MSAVLDDVLGIVLECAQVHDVLAASATCVPWCAAARSDCYWIGFARSRWRFGAIPGAPAGTAPGARDIASLEQWEQAAKDEEQRRAAHMSISSCSREQKAFKLYGERSRRDAEVRELLRKADHMLMSKDQLKAQLVERGADALDILLRLEHGAPCEMQRLAEEVRHKMSNAWAAQNWIRLIHEPSQAETLEEGALVLSQWACPNVDVFQTRAQLEHLASRAKSFGAVRNTSRDVPPRRDEAEALIAALNRALFDELGLQGNTEDYYNPENSMLHSVLSRKRGIPISLSIIWSAVARRCGLESHPLASFPQHVLIRVPVQVPASQTDELGAEAADLYVDAFGGGKVMLFQEVLEFLQGTGIISSMAALPPAAIFHIFRQCVQVSPPVQLYLRLLRNLQRIYEGNGDTVRQEGVEEQMAALAQIAQR